MRRINDLLVYLVFDHRNTMPAQPPAQTLEKIPPENVTGGVVGVDNDKSPGYAVSGVGPGALP